MTASYTVVAQINGVSHTFACSEDQTVLAAAEAKRAEAEAAVAAFESAKG